jgi:signal transduction histidine kinase
MDAIGPSKQNSPLHPEITMQAQPQSILAARIPSSPSLPPTLATPPLKTHIAPHPASSLAETTGLAHDAGNLLAALGLYCDLLKVPGVLRPEHQHYATELRLISTRSAELIRRLLVTPVADLHDVPSFSTDAASVRPSKRFRRRSARTSDVLANTSNHAAMLLSLTPVLRRIAAGAADVTVTCQVSLPPLNFPSEIIERITVNLVRNAAEAIRRNQSRAPFVSLTPPGEIRVTLALIDDHLQLTVEDNGPGMSPTNVEAYLHPEPLPLGASHGLGHRIVHELAAASEGQLSIRVRPGQGTAFSLKWPIHAPLNAERCPPGVPTSPSTV